MLNNYQYIELSFINNFREIRRQIINTIAITFLLKKGYEAIELNSYLESTQYGYNASAKDEGNFRLLRITDINGGEVNWNNVPYCECEDAEKYLMKRDDILIARTGGTTGKSFLIEQAPSNALFASYLIRLRANKDCLPEFINIFLNSYVFWSQISELKSGSAQPNVNAEKLKLLSIPDCPVDIQQKIIEVVRGNEVRDTFSLELKEDIESILLFLNKNEELKKELDQQHTYLQLLRQTILQEAVQGKLTNQDPTDEPATALLPRIKAEKAKLIKEGKLKKEKELPPIKEEEIPFDLPEGWVWCRLGEIFNDLKYGTSQKCDYKKAKHAVLRIPNLSKGGTNLEDLKFANLPEAEFLNLKLEIDDMLVIRSNGSENLVGRTAVFKGAEFDCAYAGYLMRLRFYRKLLLVDYIHQVLESGYIRNLIEFPLRTTSGVKNINSTEVSNLLIPLPPLAEQHRIVIKLQQLHQKLNQLEAQVQQSRKYAQELLQSVLKEAFSSKEQVYEVKEEPLSMVAED